MLENRKHVTFFELKNCVYTEKPNPASGPPVLGGCPLRADAGGGITRFLVHDMHRHGRRGGLVEHKFELSRFELRCNHVGEHAGDASPRHGDVLNYRERSGPGCGEACS